MALFEGRVPRFPRPPESFFSRDFVVRVLSFSGIHVLRRGFLWGARREVPGSWKLGNQEANGPRCGPILRVFAAPEMFKFGNLRGVRAANFGDPRVAPGVLGGGKEGIPRGLDTQ